MKKILINRKPVDGPWGGGTHFVRAFCKHAGDFGFEVVHTFFPNLDSIFIMDPRYDELGISINEIAAYKKVNPSTKIIHRVNENSIRNKNKSMDSILDETSQFVDVAIHVSNWNRDYHIERGKWKCNNNYVVYNAVDYNIFKPYNNKIKNGKINLVSCHWSSNFNKWTAMTQNLNDFLDKEKYTFTCVGRPYTRYNNTTIIAPMHGKRLAKEISRYDVSITSSIYDPFSNGALESQACGVPTYAIRSGGMPEAVGDDHCFDNFEDLLDILNKENFEPNNTKYFKREYTWEKCIENYFDIINSSILS